MSKDSNTLLVSLHQPVGRITDPTKLEVLRSAVLPPVRGGRLRVLVV